MNISGINSLIHYKSINKRILLLGEAHHGNNECGPIYKNAVDVSAYIAELIEQIPQDECLDIFLEGTYKNPLSFPTESGLRRIKQVLNKTFLSSFLESIKLKEKKKLRIHHVDPRALLDDRSWIWNSWNFYEVPRVPVMFEDSESQFRALISKSDLRRAIDYLLTINQEENIFYFHKIFKVFEELGFEINDVNFWEESYFKIINKELGKLDKTIISRETLISNLKDTYEHIIFNRPEGFDSGDEFDELFGLLVMVPMDVYTLSRMFVKFNKQGGSCNKSTVDNIIIHSGNAHTLIYEHFLNTLFGIQPEVRETNKFVDDLCLLVPKFNFWD